MYPDYLHQLKKSLIEATKTQDMIIELIYKGRICLDASRTKLLKDLEGLLNKALLVVDTLIQKEGPR